VTCSAKLPEPMEMKVIDAGDKKMLLFSSGRVYKCFGDMVKECKPKVEIVIDPKSYKVHKFAYICFNGRKYSLAKLVATAFVANPQGYKKLKRADGDVLNNAADNLRWVSSNRHYVRISREQLEGIDRTGLGLWNKAAVEFILTDNEAALHGFCFGGSLYHYLYHALHNAGVCADRVTDHLDAGYELFKRRLKAYYLPVAGELGENRLRRYAYFCYLYAQDGRFVPRELSKQLDSEQVLDYL
jgi:hypothetical protein